jgi:GT2 family glycosyltransferase
MTRNGPTLVGNWPALGLSPDPSRTGVTVINFNTSAQTLRCIASLAACKPAPQWVLVLDNASRDEDFAALREGCHALQCSELRLYRSEENLGFAAGSNFLVDELMSLPQCAYVGLLNNDAVAYPPLVGRLVQALDAAGDRAGLAGARMHRLHAPEEVDTLGITLYASLMPADRKSLDDPYLGPTGGCCLMARKLVDDLLATSGYCFDARYFCYCEDTDLVLRAALLGYTPAFVDEVLALHEGQASSGGGYNSFIAYHGLRNAIWMHLKLVPDDILVRHRALLLLAHVLTCVRYSISGRFGLVWRIYRDAMARRHEFRRERAHLWRRARISVREFESRLASSFYRKGYVILVLRQLYRQLRPLRNSTRT